LNEPLPTAPVIPPLAPMVRRRTAIIVGVVSLLIGMGIGAAATKPSLATTPPPPIALASQAPTLTLTPTSVDAVTCSEPAATSSPEPTVRPTPEPTPIPLKPVVVKGTGSQKTKPFTMPDGDFTVVVTVNSHSNVIVDLVPRGDSFGDNLFNEISNGSYKYETVVYGVSAGSYYLDVTIERAWVVTFTPLP
jgi:hypothetical protein